MKKRKSFLIFLILIVCFSRAKAEDQTPFEIVSSAFKQDEEFPSAYSCLGSDANPPLAFRHVPPKTKALALTMHSPDAPEGEWVHWVVYNIPLDKTDVAENTVPGYQALNDFGKYNYVGPCPTDDKVHHFVFRAYALKETLPIDEGMTMKDLERIMGGRILAKSELTVNFRKPLW